MKKDVRTEPSPQPFASASEIDNFEIGMDGKLSPHPDPTFDNDGRGDAGCVSLASLAAVEKSGRTVRSTKAPSPCESSGSISRQPKLQTCMMRK